MALTGAFGPVMSDITPTSASGASPFEEHFAFTLPANLIHATNRLKIDNITQLETYRVKRFAFSTLGDAHVYEINPTAGQVGWDLWIDLVGTSNIEIPIHIKQGWRNVYGTGIDMQIVDQLAGYTGGTAVSAVVVGNGRFQLPNKPTGSFTIGATVLQATGVANATVDTHRNSTLFSDGYAGIGGWNKDARIPSGMCGRLEMSGFAYFEGCDFNPGGRQGDLFVLSSNGVTPVSANNTNLKLYLQACRTGTNENQGDDPVYGDGVHGDLCQGQSSNTYGKNRGWWLDHVYHKTSGNGLIATGGGGAEIAEWHMNNFVFELDDSFEETHPSMTTGNKSGGPVAAAKLSYPYNTDLWTVNNVYYGSKSYALHFKNSGHKIVALDDNPTGNRIGHAGAHTGTSSALTTRLAAANVGIDYIRPTLINGGATHILVS